MRGSDERIARRAAGGDERAFEEIFRRYHQNLYRFCLATLGSAHDAQDALQNTMVKVLRALPGERREIQLKPWLYRIARNESIELLRRRREVAELDEELPQPGAEVEETAASRERLSHLIADLRELPERQRSMLVMRELAGLEYEQICEAFETSPGVARQTLYEARRSLGQMEAGREMECERVMHELSDADGRVSRRREIRAHLRDCPECRAFAEGIERRRGELAAIAPLPLAVSAGILHGALGAAAGSAGAGAAAGGSAGAVGASTGAAAGGAGSAAGGGAVAAAGAGKAIAGSAVAKSVAAVAVAAVVGVTAADRGGLIDVPVGGGSDQSSPAPRVREAPSVRRRRAASVAAAKAHRAAGGGASTAAEQGARQGATPPGAAQPPVTSRAAANSPAATPASGRSAGNPSSASGHRHTGGPSQHASRGQQTASSHKSTHANQAPAAGPRAVGGKPSAPRGAKPEEPSGGSAAHRNEAPQSPPQSPSKPDSAVVPAPEKGSGKPIEAVPPDE